MKGHRLPFLIIALVFLAAAPAAFGQTSADLAAQANLQASYTVTAGATLDFGDIIPDADGGTVTITADGLGGSRLLTGVLAGAPAAGNEGSFDVFANQILTNYTVLFTSGVVSDGTNTMNVSAINRTGDVNGVIDFPIGTTTIYFGATLTIGTNQPTGSYSTGNPSGVPVSVSVIP